MELATKLMAITQLVCLWVIYKTAMQIKDAKDEYKDIYKDMG